MIYNIVMIGLIIIGIHEVSCLVMAAFNPNEGYFKESYLYKHINTQLTE